MEEREQTKRLMHENLDQLRQKKLQEKVQDDEEKHRFNNKVSLDQMQEQQVKTYEQMQKLRQRQELQEWFKDESYRKSQLQQMLREKERYDHLNYVNHVDENYNKALKEHFDTINKHA